MYTSDIYIGSRSYIYIAITPLFQVSTGDEMAIMGVMLCLGFTKIGDFSRTLDA